MAQISQNLYVPAMACAAVLGAAFVLALWRLAPANIEAPKGRRLAASVAAAGVLVAAEEAWLYFYYGAGLDAIFAYALATALLVPIARCDLKQHLIPTRMLAAGLAARAVLLAAEAALYGMAALRAAALAAAAGAALMLAGILCRLVTPNGIGMGDVKLLGVYGLCLGLERVWSAVIWSLVLLFFGVLYLLIFKKAGRKTEVPFAPFLLGGTVAAAILSGA